jgi:hypothetical protein
LIHNLRTNRKYAIRGSPFPVFGRSLRIAAIKILEFPNKMASLISNPRFVACCKTYTHKMRNDCAPSINPIIPPLTLAAPSKATNRRRRNAP